MAPPTQYAPVANSDQSLCDSPLMKSEQASAPPENPVSVSDYVVVSQL